MIIKQRKAYNHMHAIYVILVKHVRHLCGFKIKKKDFSPPEHQPEEFTWNWASGATDLK